MTTSATEQRRCPALQQTILEGKGHWPGIAAPSVTWSSFASCECFIARGSGAGQRVVHVIHLEQLRRPQASEGASVIAGTRASPSTHAYLVLVAQRDRGLLPPNSPSSALKRGAFRCVVDLLPPSNRFVAQTNHDPKPFTWTADPDKIIAAVRRGHQVLDSIH